MGLCCVCGVCGVVLCLLCLCLFCDCVYVCVYVWEGCVNEFVLTYLARCPTSLRCSESNDFGFCNGNCDACFVASGACSLHCRTHSSHCMVAYADLTAMAGSPNSCPAPGKQCSDFTSCAACTDQPGCGWCPESAKCVPGTEFGAHSTFVCKILCVWVCVCVCLFVCA